MPAKAAHAGLFPNLRNGPTQPFDPSQVDARRALRRPSVLPLPSPSRPLVQRCGAGPCDCAEQQEEGDIHRKPVERGLTEPDDVPPVVHDVLKSHGTPLSADARAFFEPRFGQDFSMVRLHSDARAAASARAVGARGYTVGNDIVLGEDAQWVPTASGGKVLAHELAHVIQQRGRVSAQAKLTVGEADSPAEREADRAAEDVMRTRELSNALRPGGGLRAGIIQRACLSGAVCAAPPGSSTAFGSTVQTDEAAARARRAKMSPARQRAHGHAGHARALERFFNGQAPGLLGNIHGIFVDQDMDPKVGASRKNCADMIPPVTGAVKSCVFVHGQLNQEAETFNTAPEAKTIGGRSRESWRIATLQALVHEVQHVLYNTAVPGSPKPGGVTSCERSDVNHELSELNAIMSEFPAVFDAVPAAAPSTDPAAHRLARWFDFKITNPGESIEGILTTIRCKCDCGDADAFIKETFKFVSSSWSITQKDAFNAELRKPARALGWPL
jgi:hypothetical protein